MDGEAIQEVNSGKIKKSKVFDHFGMFTHRFFSERRRSSRKKLQGPSREIWLQSYELSYRFPL